MSACSPRVRPVETQASEGLGQGQMERMPLTRLAPVGARRPLSQSRIYPTLASIKLTELG